jgi:hypothetical protein
VKPVHIVLAVALLGSLTGLAGCAAPPPTEATGTPTDATGAEQDSGTPLDPRHALFDETNLRTSRSSSPTGAAFISGLRAAGFAAESLEVSADVTSAGLKAPSIQFAALVGSTCLIGQYGPDGTGYRSVTAAPIATGQCLIGAQSG